MIEAAAEAAAAEAATAAEAAAADTAAATAAGAVAAAAAAARLGQLVSFFLKSLSKNLKNEPITLKP